MIDRGRAVAWTAASLLALAAGCRGYEQQRGSEMADSDFPVVSLKLGDSIGEVQAASSYRFELGDSDWLRPVAVTQPVILQYSDPERGFTLPPARFVWLTVLMDHVTGLKVSPQLEYLDLDSALSLAGQLIELVDRSGWTREARAYPSLDELRAEFTDPATRVDQSLSIQRWRAGGDDLYVTLARAWGADESLPQMSGRHEDLFLLTVFLENDSITNKYLKASQSPGGG